jgi:hypothetical protein
MPTAEVEQMRAAKAGRKADGKAATHYLKGSRTELGEAYTAFNKARAKKEEHNAKLAEYEQRKAAGELLDAAKTLAEIQSILSTVRNKFLAVPTRAAPLVVGNTSIAKVESIIRKLVNEALSELANDA